MIDVNIYKSNGEETKNPPSPVHARTETRRECAPAMTKGSDGGSDASAFFMGTAPDKENNMTDQNTQRYHIRMNRIKAILALLQTEAEQAEQYRAREGIQQDDADELDRVIGHLTRAYGVLAADEDIRGKDVLRIAGAM